VEGAEAVVLLAQLGEEPDEVVAFRIRVVREPAPLPRTAVLGVGVGFKGIRVVVIFNGDAVVLERDSEALCRKVSSASAAFDQTRMEKMG
jgi:hypothetical protein